MKRISLILILTFSFVCKSCNSQQIKKAHNSLSITNKKNKELIEKYTSTLHNNTNVSIAIIRDKTTEYYGIFRENDTLKNISNKEDLYEIGSISKVFTSSILANLVTNKTIDLNDRLSNFFDFKLNEGNNITLEQLANHTSGLPRMPSNKNVNREYKNPYKNYTPKLLEEYLKNDITLENEIGKVNKYSNLGVGLLGYILTKKTNKTYENLLKEIICNSLQMNNTTTLRDNITNNNLVKGIDRRGKITSNWDFTDALVGAGGIKSSVSDLEKFVRKNIEKDNIYNLTHKQTFFINDKMSIGLGWHILTKNEILWHNGGTGGYKSCLAFNKQKKVAVIILSNVSGLSKNKSNIDKLCFELIKNN